MSKYDIGVLVPLNNEPEKHIKQVSDFGLESCQVCSWNPQVWNDENGKKMVAACEKYGIKISTFWAGYTGPCVWNFLEGPITIGLVPPEHREQRVKELKQAADYAAKFGIQSITTHVGFLPENPKDQLYIDTVEALKEICSHCKDLGIDFLFETGQETPVTLLRTIEWIGLDNVGINLDTANVILYGKGNPVDSLEVFGKYVKDLHIKDGCFPTNGNNLGKQVPLGEGKVDFKAVIDGLKKLGYTGPLTIECECGGKDNQNKLIQSAIELLEPLR